MLVKARGTKAMTRIGLLACATGVCLIVSGCGASKSDTHGNAPGKASNKQVAKFTFAIAGAPTSFDITKDYGNFGPIALVNEQLEHSRSDGTYSPGLADKVTAGPTEITYHIRSGARFTDGTPLTPDDVVFSIQRAIAAGAQTAGVLGSVASAKAVGSDVTVTLKQADPAVRALLDGAVPVVEKSFVQAHTSDFGSPSVKTVGTGPYVLDRFDSTKAEFTRNSAYWGPKPKIAKIEIDFLNSDDTTQLALRSGDVNATLLVDTSNIRLYKAIPGVSLVPFTGNSVQYLSLDMNQGPLDDVHVRKAIAYSIDRVGLIKSLFSGYAQQLQGFMTPTELASVSSQSDAQAFLSGLPQYPFDLTKAKQELVQSQHASGLSFTIYTSSSFPWSQNVALNVQQNMKSLGVAVSIKSVEPKTYVAQVYSHKGLAARALSLAALTPDAAYILKLISGSATAVPNGLNTADFASGSVDSDIKTLSTSSDTAARFAAAKGLLQAIADQVPYVPLFNQQTVWVNGKGFTYNAKVADGNDWANGVWVYNVSAAA